MKDEMYNFDEIFDREAMQQMMDALAQAFEVGLSVRTPSGERIINDACFCRFCSDVVRKSEEGSRQCELSDMELITASDDGSRCIYRCQSAGLIDAEIKIVIPASNEPSSRVCTDIWRMPQGSNIPQQAAGYSTEGEHIASILVGQVRLEEEQLSEEEYRRIAQEFGVDGELYLRRLREVPLKTREKFEHIVNAVTIVADQLSVLGYNNLYQKHKIGMLERKESMLQNLAEKDALTGLLNRHKFEESMEQYENRKDIKINLVSGDANNLKLMNDIFGHEAGDKMLYSIAEKMKSMASDEWIVARCGGDEFRVLIPDSTLKMAKVYCKRVSNSCKNDRRLDLPLSIAFGVAEWDSGSETLQECFARADNLMYENKKRMKQQVNLLDYILDRLYDRCLLYRENIEAETELAYDFARHLGFNEEGAARVRAAAKYQDIGMIKLPENFVMKGPSRTPEENMAIQAHVTNGYNILLQFENTHDIAEFILYAHENWDGNSYPKGLKGQTIPLESRIIRMINNYCNWTVRNTKKVNVDKETAVRKLRDRAGVMFDPDMVEWFISYLDEREAYLNIS